MAQLNPKTAAKQWSRKFKKKYPKSEGMGNLFNMLTGSKWETVRNQFFTGKTAFRVVRKQTA